MLENTNPHMIRPARNYRMELKLLIQIFVSVVCFLWVIYIIKGIDWAASKGQIANISGFYFVACLLVMGGLYALKMYRLIRFVNTLAPGCISFKEWMGLYLKSVAFGSLTPARIGDFSRILMLGRTNLSLKTRSHVIFYDKCQDLLYIPIVMCLTAPVVHDKLGIPEGLLIPLGIFFLCGFLGVSYGMGRFLGVKMVLFGWGVTIAGLFLFVAGNSLLFKSIGWN